MVKIMKCLKRIDNNRGSMLLISYFVITVILGLGAAITLYSANEARVAERERLAVTAFNIAEAGLERGLYDLRQDFLSGGANPSWVDGTINGYSITLNDSSFTTMPYASSITNFNSGTFLVQLQSVGEDVWIQSTGTISGVSFTVKAYTKIVDSSPWGYAIFAGAGAGGMMINGNVDIRGSVLVLGNGLNPGDLAMDLGGTAQLVGNNYSGLSAALLAKIPALPTKMFNGDMVSTINGKLRVKRGIVGLSGSATLGEPNVAGNSVKETVDGSFVTDGWSGNQGSNNVFSDNGSTNGWDLGDAVKFPSLSDPAPEDGTKTVQEYYKANALVLTNQLASITPTSTFSYSNANGSISMAGGVMTVSGRVYVDGNNVIAMNKAGSNKTISYTGSGSLLSTGNVDINVNLITPGNNSYPNNAVGIMTPGTITMNEAGIAVMSLLYAENSIVAMKQTNIVGSIVSNYFDMGTNVPSIYQVPDIVNHMPPGMIGNSSKSFMVVVWQKT